MTVTWQYLDDVLSHCGGSAYIFKPDAFADNVRECLSAFRQHYPKTSLGYSYKTNYLKSLCVQADRLGLYAEVVSGMEYEMARRFGVGQQRIIFNGPLKTKADLEMAVAGGSLINLDNYVELALLRRLLVENPSLCATVGLRCSLDLVWRGRPSRFGFSTANGNLQKAVALVRSLPNATLAGLHCHFSFDRTAGAYEQRTRAMLRIARGVFRDAPPRFLDLGGGFCGPMPEVLSEQLGYQRPSYADYAAAIVPALLDEYGLEGGPELILEPGVGLVGNCIEYACRVTALKTLPGRQLAITTGSIQHLKVVPNSINLPMQVVHAPHTGASVPVGGPMDITGFTCLEHDVLFDKYSGAIVEGDILLFSNVGAYSLVSSPWFILPTPPVVEANGDSWRTVMRQATIDELLARFE